MYNWKLNNILISEIISEKQNIKGASDKNQYEYIATSKWL
jgi:hypothetical protein